MVNKKQPIDFYECQSNKPLLVWIVLIGVNLVLICGFVWQIILGNTFGNNPMPNVGLILTTAVIFLFSIVVIVAKLKTFIDNDGIAICFFPFILKPSFYSWSDIEDMQIVKNRCAVEYRGWGVRKSYNKKEVTVSGQYGLLITLKNKKKIFIGTQMPDEIETIIKIIKVDDK